MNSAYIYFNVALVALLALGIYSWAKEETKDVYMLNARFQELSSNSQCLNYLQTVTNIPYWRFAIFSSAGYTAILFILYLLTGSPVTKTVVAMAWLLFILNTVFIYKTIGTRDFHYVCKNNCLPNW